VIFPTQFLNKGVGKILRCFYGSADEALWSEKTYNNFMLDLEFKNADGTNSGVIVHASNMEEWIPHSVEIQIADDYSRVEQSVVMEMRCNIWSPGGSSTNCKPAVNWNHFTITCIDRNIWVVLKWRLVNTLI
jgi:hypothetical protein